MLYTEPQEMHVIVWKGALEDTCMFNTRTSITSKDIHQENECDAHLCAGGELGGRVREGVYNVRKKRRKKEHHKTRCEKVELS